MFMTTTRILAASLSFGLFLPAIASAYFGEIDTFFGNVLGFINGVLIPLIFTVALLAFVWGMTKFFVINGDNEGERKKGKDLMVWSIAGFVLMVSIWGIVNLIAGGLFSSATTPTLPGIPTL